MGKRPINRRSEMTVSKSVYRHSNKLGAGAKKRRGLRDPQDKVGAVMGEFKRGTLHSGSGEIVKKRSQAVAIAMSEAEISRSKDYLKKKRKK